MAGQTWEHQSFISLLSLNGSAKATIFEYGGAEMDYKIDKSVFEMLEY